MLYWRMFHEIQRVLLNSSSISQNPVIREYSSLSPKILFSEYVREMLLQGSLPMHIEQ